MRSPRARAVVDAGFHAMDLLCGTVLLALLGFLSLLGIVAWAQHQVGAELEQSLRHKLVSLTALLSKQAVNIVTVVF